MESEADSSSSADAVKDERSSKPGRAQKQPMTQLKNITDDQDARGRSSGRIRESSIPLKRSHSAIRSYSRTRSRSRRDLQRKRRHTTEEYRQLLNEQILQAANPFSHTAHQQSDSRDLQPSHIGLSSWTPTEKSSLFTALSLHGRHDLGKLSTAVATKSGLEIQQHLTLLHQGLREQHRHFRRETLLRYADVPSAHEVSVEGCNALELAADGLQAYQYAHEERTERAKWGRWWKVTDEVAWTVEDLLDPQENSDSDGEAREANDKGGKGETWSDAKFMKLRPAAEFFDLPIWLELSRRVFMNSPSQPDVVDEADEGSPNNWVDMLEGFPEGPSLFATVVADFYNLAVSVTKRIIVTTLFHATARLRASATERKPRVRKSDVWTAVDILGMKRDTNEFWIRAARRLKLNVHDPKWRKHVPIERKRSLGRRLGYDEVEGMLRLSKREWLRGDFSASRKNEDHEGEMEEPDISIPGLPESTNEDELAKEHEREAEVLDSKASAEEELRLCSEVLGREVSEGLGERLKESVALKVEQPRVKVKRKSEGELRDWREELDYKAEWEDGELWNFEKVRAPLVKLAKVRKERRERRQPEAVDESERSESEEETEDSEDDEGLEEKKKKEIGGREDEENSEDSTSSSSPSSGSPDTPSSESEDESTSEDDLRSEDTDDETTSMSSGARSTARRRRTWYNEPLAERGTQGPRNNRGPVRRDLDMDVGSASGESTSSESSDDDTTD